MSVGRMTMMAAALVSAQFWLNRLWKARKLVVTGFSSCDCRMVIAKKNSFQAISAATRATTRTPGHAKGITIRVKTCNSPAPSTRAASSSSRGNARR
ncbi:hypothetical protein D3C83_60960 [compost metagenome]